jgi:hypothetical protein
MTFNRRTNGDVANSERLRRVAPVSAGAIIQEFSSSGDDDPQHLKATTKSIAAFAYLISPMSSSYSIFKLGFPELGVPPVLIHLNGIFHEINIPKDHPFEWDFQYTLW